MPEAGKNVIVKINSGLSIEGYHDGGPTQVHLCTRP